MKTTIMKTYSHDTMSMVCKKHDVMEYKCSVHKFAFTIAAMLQNHPDEIMYGLNSEKNKKS